MKRLLFLLVMAPFVMVAQTENPPASPVTTVEIKPAPFSYDPTTLVFKWDLSLSNKGSGQSTDCKDCVIDFTKRTMTRNGKSRLFSEKEAEVISRKFKEFYLFVAVYAAESMMWWDEGRGIKLGPDGKPLPGQEEPAKPVVPTRQLAKPAEK